MGTLRTLARLTLVGAGALVIGGGLGGCATNCTGDPRTDNLACASAGLSSGSYRAQTHALEAQAALSRQRAAAAAAGSRAAQARAAALGADRAATQARVDAQARELAQLEAERSRLQVRLRTAQNGGDAAQVARLQEEIAVLQRRIERIRR